MPDENIHLQETGRALVSLQNLRMDSTCFGAVVRKAMGMDIGPVE